MRIMIKRLSRVRRWDVCELRRGHDGRGVYLDRDGGDRSTLLGWRLMVPGAYVLVMFGAGWHRRPRLVRAHRR